MDEIENKFSNYKTLKYLLSKLKTWLGHTYSQLFTVNNSLTMSDENVLGVSTPVNGVINQEDFDALPEEQQTSGLWVIPGNESVDEPSQEIYSTKETRIGTWIDGKPLYRICGRVKSPGTLNSFEVVYPAIPDAEPKKISAMLNTSTGSYNPLLFPGTMSQRCGVVYNEEGLRVVVSYQDQINVDIDFIIEYTKTTDEATIQIESSATQKKDSINASENLDFATATTSGF